ncbi:MAG: hypothetical protein R3D60_13160 [Paracoccaceae bacterium]
MTLSFPMPWSDFAARLPIQSAPWTLKRFEEITWSAGSVPSVSDLADPRWSVRVTLDVLSTAEAVDLQTLLELHGAAHPFLMHDPERPGPRLDPNGATLGAASPSVASIGADGVSLKGLPAGYVLSRGDLLSIAHGSAGQRGLYVLGETITADGTGVTPVAATLPRLRSIAAADDPVGLINPTGLMLVVPGSYDAGEPNGVIRRGMRFDAVEAW